MMTSTTPAPVVTPETSKTPKSPFAGLAAPAATLGLAVGLAGLASQPAHASMVVINDLYNPGLTDTTYGVAVSTLSRGFGSFSTSPNSSRPISYTIDTVASGPTGSEMSYNWAFDPTKSKYSVSLISNPEFTGPNTWVPTLGAASIGAKNITMFADDPRLTISVLPGTANTLGIVEGTRLRYTFDLSGISDFTFAPGVLGVAFSSDVQGGEIAVVQPTDGSGSAMGKFYESDGTWSTINTFGNPLGSYSAQLVVDPIVHAVPESANTGLITGMGLMGVLAYSALRRKK